MSSLWVGNLAVDVTDADLQKVFGRFGPIHNITLYTSKFFAFVNYQRSEDAKAAKEALNGAVLHGNALKIDFARPAKPCKSLWVGGISLSVTKQDLEEQFSRFGKIQEFKFLRERNTAYVDYFTVEDATEALKNLNGLQIGGNNIRVDYLRSQATRKEQPDQQFINRSTGASNPQWNPQGVARSFADPYGSTRPQTSIGPKGDGQPSNVLWVSYPPSFIMDDKMLHNAMILFGEIEGITSFPSENYSLVEFRSVEEATRAKEGLEGRLFSDPRILIMYSNSGLAPSKGPRTDVFLNDTPGRAGTIANTFTGYLPPHAVSGPDMLRRPLMPQGSFQPTLQQGPEFSALTKLHNLHDSNSNILLGSSNRKRLSPSPGVLPSPSQAMKPSINPVSGAWDVFDVSQLQRESKKSRVGGLLGELDPSLERMDGSGLGFGKFHGHGLRADGGITGAAAANVRGMNPYSPLDAGMVNGGIVKSHPEHDCIWRGVIAKGGTHVCRARCVPVEKDFEFEIPEVVNCSARTGLDMLAKHYGDAVGFSIIFFLPDSIEDFAPYTEFLRYLGAKNRAGVAKFDDGNTLFLVPPSDFLRNTLKITGPERLYGLVLKFQNHVVGGTSQQTHLAHQHYTPSELVNKVMPHEERFQQIGYNISVHEDQNTFSKPPGPSIINPVTGHAQQATSTSLGQAGVTLTPELIATLASLLPTKGNTSSAAQQFSGSYDPEPIFPPATDRGQSQGWDHEQSKVPNQSGYPINQVGNQYNPQAQFPSELQYVGMNAHTASNQVRDATHNMIQHGDLSFRQRTNSDPHPRGEQFLVSPQVNPQYHFETPQESRHGYFQQGDNVSGAYSASFQGPTNSDTLSHQVSSLTHSQQQNGNPVGGENIGFESQGRVQTLPSHSGAAEGMSDLETDKNERYRSTLQFAANLLLQIQQQNPSSDAVHGRGGN